jgi:PAS domain S-box-containing protein
MNGNLRILQLEDSKIDAELIAAKLQEDGVSCTIDWVDSQDDYAARLAQGGFDLILADYTLPSFDGLSALMMAREKYPDVPFIFVSGTIGEDRAIETFKNGATDYVLKEHLSRLVPSIRRALKEKEERDGLKRVHEALRESSQFNQQVIDSAGEGIIVYGRDLRYQIWNPFMERLTGLSSGDVLGKRPLDVFPFLRDAGVMATLDQAFTGAPSTAIDFLYHATHGSRWITHASAPIRNIKGEVIGVIGTVQDITERKLAEEEHRKSEKKYKDLVDSTLDGVYQVDADGIFVMMNPAGAGIFGYESPEEMIGRNALEYWRDPRDRDAFRAELKSKKSVSAYHMRARDKNGKPLELESSSIIREDANCNFLGIDGILRDVTERMRAQEALQESRERYKRLVESVTSYIYTVRVENGVAISTTHGLACVGVTGYEAEEYAADPYLWYRMIHQDDRDGVEQAARKVLSRERAGPIEHRIIHKDGSVRWVKDTMVPRYDERSLLVAYDGLVTDITEQRAAEETIKKNNEELETRVRERTKELEQSKREIESAKNMAEVANKTKSDFLANMSHELRTPLNSILGFSQVLQDGLYGPMNAKQEDYVNNIYSSGNHLLSLINDILDLSKVESGKIELDLSTVSLENVLHGAISMLKEKAMKHGVSMALDIGPGATGEINTDERKLKQIMFNLLSNAVKFTPEGGSVRVSARLMEDEGRGTRDEKEESSIVRASEARDRPSSVEISVADTGIGIKPEDMDKLFKPFSQVESVYTKTYEGTGLGLALTKRLAEILGGRIWAESEFGKESVFTFVIPFNREKGNKQEGG